LPVGAVLGGRARSIHLTVAATGGSPAVHLKSASQGAAGG
jgi:hypothetical protein